MRVLHVITGLASGGAEQQLRLLLRHSRAEAEVATLTNPGLVARAIRDEGTVVHELAMAGNTDFTVLPRLVKLIRGGAYDVVHTHLYRACVYGRVAARLAFPRRRAGAPAIVATEHSLGSEHIEGRPLTSFARHLYLATERLGSVTIAVSATVGLRLLLWGVPTERIVVIGNGIEPESYRFDPTARERTRTALGIPPDRFVVGSVGRLVPGKRVDRVLRALPFDATALIVGGGPEAPGLVALARELDVEAVFTGETAGVTDLLSAMDLLVFASAEETFGVAVVEALAAGLPVLYAACPAVDNLPDELRNGMPSVRRLATDLSDLRPALAAAARTGAHRTPVPDAVAHYDIATQAARVDELYARLSRRPTPDRSATSDRSAISDRPATSDRGGQ